jgi:hypothetical protein
MFLSLWHLVVAPFQKLAVDLARVLYYSCPNPGIEKEYVLYHSTNHFTICALLNTRFKSMFEYI